MCPLQLLKAPLLSKEEPLLFSIEMNPILSTVMNFSVLHIEESLFSPFGYTPNFKAGSKDKFH